MAQERRAVHTYVINLERSPERRSHMQAELERLRLDYEFVAAVEGRDIDRLGPSILRPGDAHAGCSRAWEADWELPGLAGCALSHLQVYEAIVASGAAVALVLEDDVTLDPDISPVTMAVVPHLSGAEVVLLSFDSDDTCLMSSSGAQDLAGGRLLALPLDIRKMASAAGYLITREACLRMLESMRPARAKPDDWAFFYENEVIDRLRCVLPMPVRKSPRFASTIMYDHGSITGKFKGAVRRSDTLAPALAWRRRRIWRRHNTYKLVNDPFRSEASRLDPPGSEGRKRSAI